MRIKSIVKILYGFFGAVFLIGGAGVMLLHTGLLPGAAKNIIREVAHDDPNTLHIIQEFGSLLVFAGLISFWFVRHYAQSRVFHWAMTTFWALFALAHWYGAEGFARSIREPRNQHDSVRAVPCRWFAPYEQQKRMTIQE